MDEFNISLNSSGSVQKKKEKKDTEFEINTEVSLFNPEETELNFDGIEITGADVKPPEPEIPKESEFVSSLNNEDKELCINVLDFVLRQSENALKEAVQRGDEGTIGYIWDGFKNITGMRFGSETIKNKINELKKQIEDVKTGSLPLGYLYKNITGNELNETELQNLKNGKLDLSNVSAMQDVSGYEAGKKEAPVTAAFIASMAAAYATGGSSLLVQFGVSAGTYTAVKGADEIATNDGWTREEMTRDAIEGCIQGALTVSAGKIAKGAGNLGRTFGLSNKALMYTQAHTAASVFGLKPAADYSINQLLSGKNIDTDKAVELLIQGEAAANLGAFAGVNLNMVLNPALTKGISAPSQIIGRLGAKGLSGAAAGSIAASGGETAAYLTRCAQNNEEFSLEGISSALLKNTAQGAVSGFLFGTLFEAADIVKGMGKPEGTVKTEHIKTENGIKITKYTNKDGSVTCDISANKLTPEQKQSLGIIKDMPERTVRLTMHKNIQIVKDGKGGYTAVDLKKMDALMNTLPETVPAPSKEAGIIPANPFKNNASVQPPKNTDNKIDAGTNRMLLEIKHQNRQDVHENADQLFDTGKAYIEEAQSQIESVFSHLETSKKITGRPKGPGSIAGKIETKLINGKLQKVNIESCTKAIGDLYGTRLQMKSLPPQEASQIIDTCLKGTGISRSEILEYIHGKKDGLTAGEISRLDAAKTSVLNALKEAQSQDTVNAIIKAINDKNTPFEFTELNNYGDEISSYFTGRQVQQIADAYFKRYGTNMKIVSHQNPAEALSVGITDEYGSFRSYPVKEKGSVKDSGYTSAQMNVTHKFGDNTSGLGEFQMRGELVNSFADVEHIPYDIRQDKIHANNPKYSDIYKVIKGMSQETYTQYNRYLTDAYHARRLNELGIAAAEPDIADYIGNLPESSRNLLSVDGLIEISKRGH